MKLKASYTIEASFIFPVILFSLITLLYIIIYVHDLVCLQSIANRGILYIEEQLMTTDYQLRLEGDSDFEEELKSFVKEEMNKTLFMKGKEESVISLDYKDFIFFKEMELYISKDFITPFGKLSFIKMEAESNARFIEGNSFIRMVDFVGDVTSEITITSTWKDKYEIILEEIKIMIGEWI